MVELATRISKGFPFIIPATAREIFALGNFRAGVFFTGAIMARVL
jgi:hypothetical protein